MNSPLRINRLYIIFSFLLFSNLLVAQGSSNMSLLGNWDENTISRSGVKYNDIWGYVDDLGNEYAIVGSPQKVHFIDVTDPANLVQLAEFTPGASTVWRDFKIYDRFVYGVADEGSEGLLVFDMNSLPNGEICQVYQDNSIFGRAHNIFIDVPEGILYVVGANTNDWIVYDLKPDPANPTLIANQGVYGGYIHDMFVNGGVAYASSETSLIMFDITDPTNPTYIAEQGTNGYNHSSWLSEDGNNVIFAEESSGFSLGVLDITNAGNDDIPVINSFKFPLEEAATGDTRIVYHNPFILGDYAIVSSYYDGVTIFNISDPNNVTMDAYYDTFVNNGYSGYAADGCWGVYPYLPSGNIIASDTETGLYVLSTTVPLPTGRCGNGVTDPFEQGQDCGGFCVPCGTPTTTCASCTDGILNGSETDVDCGGTVCTPCVGCNDGIQNGAETGIDCGGSCIACPTCTDGIQNGTETAIDCGGTDCAACIEDCSTYDFTGQVVGYDVGGNDNGTFIVQDAGATVFMTGNAWKAVPINYTVTSNTILEFDFRSDVEGEIHEIAFDNDLIFSPDHRIVVYGNQGYAGTFATPNYSGSGDFEHFTINLGANFTGTYQYLVLTCDDDANAAGDSYFSNVQIYEDYDGNLMCDAPLTCPPMDNISSTPTSGTYQASNTIISDAQIMTTENVTYGANTICLENGFEVVLGGEFSVEINPCTPFTQAPDQRLAKATTNIDTRKSNISFNQMGNSNTWIANILIEEAGDVEVYVKGQNDNETIFSGHAKAGYLRLRFNVNGYNTPQLVVQTKNSKVTKTIKSTGIIDKM